MTFFFFFNDTATTEIYTLSLHDALPILDARRTFGRDRVGVAARPGTVVEIGGGQAQRVTARGIGVGIVGAEPRHAGGVERSEEHTSELQSQSNLVCRLLLEKKKKTKKKN